MVVEETKEIKNNKNDSFKNYKQVNAPINDMKIMNHI